MTLTISLREADSPLQSFQNPVVLETAQNQAFFAHSLLAGNSLLDVQMPWEQGVFREIFGDLLQVATHGG